MTTMNKEMRSIVFPDPEPPGAEPPQLGVVFSGDDDPFYYLTGSGTQQVEVGDALALKFADHRPGQIAALLSALHIDRPLKCVEIECGGLTTADLEALSDTHGLPWGIAGLHLVLGKRRKGREAPSNTVRFADGIDWSVLTRAEMLDVRGVAVTDDHLGQLGAPSRLRIFQTDGVRITPISLRRFERLFGLFMGGDPSLGSDLSFLRHHKTLHGFGMRFSALTNDQLIHISRLPGLRLVDIAYSRELGPDLSGLDGATNLQFLELSGTMVDGTSIASLRSAKKLTQLGLQCTSLTDADMSSLRNLPRITNLNVAGTRITDAGLRTIVEALPSLRFLDIRGTAVTEHGMRVLSRAKQLFSLGLDGVLLTVLAAERLVADTNLKQVLLCDPYCGDKGFWESAEAIDIIGGAQHVGRPQ